MKTLLILAALMACVGVHGGHHKRPSKFRDYQKVNITGNNDTDYKIYVKKFHPGYTPDKHHSHRMKKFQDCYNTALNHDPDAAGYSVGLSRFCHWTDEEFNKSLNKMAGGDGSQTDSNDGTSARSLFSLEHEFDSTRQVLADYVNWVEQGAVTVAKDQASCGCCYTFAAVAALEGAYQIKYGVLVDLSTEQYVDCSVNYTASTKTSTTTSCKNGVCTTTVKQYQSWYLSTKGNQGCSGGTAQACWAYNNMSATTQNSWNCYPFASGSGISGGQCTNNPTCDIAVNVRGYVSVPANNETALMQAVSVGPVACAIDASTIQTYTGGIFTGAGCSQTGQNHAITVVGYGTDNGVPYWLVKNSWGSDWGQNGFFQLYRGNNTCGISAYCAYPLVN